MTSDETEGSFDGLLLHGAERRAAAANLASKMRDFIAFRDVSQAYVGEMEHLFDGFLDTDWGQDLGEYTAMYEPWGGTDEEPLIPAHNLARLFAWALPFVEEEARHVDDDPRPEGPHG